MLSYSFSVLCLTLARYLFTENFEGLLFAWMDYLGVGRVFGSCFLLNQKDLVSLPAAGMRYS